jgi:hypothetical protein
MIFQYHIARITPSAAVYGRAGCISSHYLQFGRALGIPFTTTNTNSFIKCRNVGLFGIQSVRYRNEQKFRCRNQSGTRMRGPCPVPDGDTGCRIADAGGFDLDAEAGGIDLDADAQLCSKYNRLCKELGSQSVFSSPHLLL